MLHHIPGKTNIPSDFLSRPPVEDKGGNDNSGVIMIPKEWIAMTQLIQVPPMLEVRRGLMSRSGHRVVRSFVRIRRAERAIDCEGRC
jgi:hypothetical protein